MADQSFIVHLQSLTDFAQELQTQLAGMTTPLNHLDSLSNTPVLLGDFGEAFSLAQSHQAAVAEMAELLGQVQQAITFAENITNTVATDYQQADQAVAQGMSVSGNNADYVSGSGGGSAWSNGMGTQDNSGNGNGWGSGGNGWGNGNAGGNGNGNGNGWGAGGEGGWT